MADLLDRITINPHQCGGRPCIRGMRIRVSEDLLAAGEILIEIKGRPTESGYRPGIHMMSS